MSNWPPKYTIHKNPRAKNVIFRVHPIKGVVITTPKWFSAKKIPKLLEEKRTLIEKHLTEIQQPALPTELYLQAIDEKWKIGYRPSINPNQARIKVLNYGRLLITASLEDFDLCDRVINKWLQAKSKLHLIPWLNKLSKQTGLQYNKVSFRGQKSRWGSCSLEKNISLNCKLLLLKPELVDYIIIHELCHTVHHDHSKQFWELVKRFSPSYNSFRKQLNMLKGV